MIAGGGGLGLIETTAQSMGFFRYYSFYGSSMVVVSSYLLIVFLARMSP